MIRCSIEKDKKQATERSKQDQDTVKQGKNEISLPQTVTLKETLINSKTIIDNKKISASIILNDREITRLALKSIDSAASDAGFKYHLIDTLFSGPQINIYLIGREYTEENILWVASYDQNSKLIDRLMVYYDNAEGFLSIGSVIKNNRISVHTQNEYAATTNEADKSEAYYFNQANKLIKQQ